MAQDSACAVRPLVLNAHMRAPAQELTHRIPRYPNHSAHRACCRQPRGLAREGTTRVGVAWKEPTWKCAFSGAPADSKHARPCRRRRAAFRVMPNQWDIMHAVLSHGDRRGRAAHAWESCGVSPHAAGLSLQFAHPMRARAGAHAPHPAPHQTTGASSMLSSASETGAKGPHTRRSRVV